MMKHSLMPLAVAALLGGTVACSFAARGPKMYEEDTRKLLETKQADIQQCYDQVLEADSTASGTVVVTFTVQAETGKIVNPAVDPQRTSAPEPVGACVTQAIDGLVLEPPDQNDGNATFAYEFKIGPAPAPAQPAPAPAATPAPPAAPPG